MTRFTLRQTTLRAAGEIVVSQLLLLQQSKIIIMINFLTTDVKLIGREFDTTNLSSFLYIGITFSFNPHLCYHCCVEIHPTIMSANGSDVVSFNSHKTRWKISSVTRTVFFIHLIYLLFNDRLFCHTKISALVSLSKQMTHILFQSENRRGILIRSQSSVHVAQWLPNL